MSETVLVVEDEASVRRVIRWILTRSGYTVLEASNARDALEIAERAPTRIQLLLTDVVLPGMGGAELADSLLQRVPGLRVLFMSGGTEDAHVRTDVRQGRKSFIQKPFTSVTLTQKVREALDGQSAANPP